MSYRQLARQNMLPLSLLISFLTLLVSNVVVITANGRAQAPANLSPIQGPNANQQPPPATIQAASPMANSQSTPPQAADLGIFQTPTKPPMVLLTKPTPAQADSTRSTAANFPQSTPFITMDVSQRPQSSLSAPSPRIPPTSQILTTTTRPPNPMASNRSQPLVEPPPSQPSLPTEPPTREATSTQSPFGLESRSSNDTVTTQPPNIEFTATQSPVSPTTSVPSTRAPVQLPAGQASSRPSSSSATRSPESRRILDGPSSSTSALSPSSVAVQFLKARSKFKCMQPSDCLNGGMCFNGTCFCPPGYTGESCAINIDECRQVEEPCLNNGICVDEVNQFRCECVAGFKGDRCQESVDMCVSSPCFNGAKCINHRTDFSCECEPGWEGRLCEDNIDECLKGPCQNNATCMDLVNDYKCDCGGSGFTGKNCDIDFDDCAIKPCGYGTKECVDLTGDFKCVCYDGFTGRKCDVDIDECQTNPCKNNGTCIEKSFNVHHLHNLTSDLTMYHEIRDQNLSSSSLNMSHYAGYTCECKEEYYGDRCEEKKKCYTKSVLELCNHPQADCINVGSSYECLINASFDGSGQNYATYRINGEFKMKEILVKYRSLTGGTIMSFETNQLDSPMADLQLNKSGLYLSGFPIKQDENIKFDEFLDGNEREIRLGLDTPTEIKSITLARQNNIDDFHSPPFKGCLTQVRLNNQLVPLVDYGSNHSFDLTESHLDVGHCRTCFEKDCFNHGHCAFQEGYDHCACPDTFTGNFCEIDVNECEKNLCLNGGTCENLHGGHRCICKEGFRGEKCQEISDYCKAMKPCVTGTCKNVNPASGTSFQCDCLSSYVGKRCDRKRDCHNECHNHHAQCINNVTCACLPGRREERIMCEYVASCEQVEGDLCLNGGTCKNLDSGGYHCLCQEPYYGPVCQFLAEKPQFDFIVLFGITCVGLVAFIVAVGTLFIFRSVRKARATRGTYSPSTQEKFGNSASDLLKPPQPERLI